MEEYITIRDLIGNFIGAKLVEITQHDEEYFQRTGRSFVDLMFDDGNVLRFYLDGQNPAMVVNPEGGSDDSE